MNVHIYKPQVINPEDQDNIQVGVVHFRSFVYLQKIEMY